MPTKKPVSKTAPKAPKSKARLLKSKLFATSRKQQLVLAVLVVGLVAFGIYKFSFSHAASLITCNNTWQPVPGNGLTINTPDISTIPGGSVKFSDTMMLTVRGVDNGVYYQPLWMWSGGHWDGVWRRLNNGSTYDTPRQERHEGGNYVSVIGTDGGVWQTVNAFWNAPYDWEGWRRIGTYGYVYMPVPQTQATHSNKIVSVRRNSNNTISYICRLSTGTAQ